MSGSKFYRSACAQGRIYKVTSAFRAPPQQHTPTPTRINSINPLSQGRERRKEGEWKRKEEKYEDTLLASLRHYLCCGRGVILCEQGKGGGG